MHSKEFWILCIIPVVLFSLAVAGQASSHPVVVNIMIDAEISPFAQNLTPAAEESLELSYLAEMLDYMDSKNINTTVYFTGDFASKQIGNVFYKDYVNHVASKPTHEIALHSMTTSDKLGLMSYQEQLSLLTRAKSLIETAYNKDNEFSPIKGFRPQYFSQSEEAYKALDEMGIVALIGICASTISSTTLDRHQAQRFCGGRVILQDPLPLNRHSRADTILEMEQHSASHFFGKGIQYLPYFLLALRNLGESGLSSGYR
jgi:peptidoglycan/xylan/chitin deacetylase (PgdA/CDA1 family)